ncbi:TetR family transcriptional regulator [Rhodoblastus sp.]|uniref:TetR/AcrR family transcriptional regulator n=1 Tax=Rhodoblastus sp. TaxID=1962975 RepID=UPI0025DD9062|nr:TetR family transcriptional regulator [Rhodoblastus sp.]
MEDRRKQIIDAGLAILAEEGLQGFTQPRIAARTGLRQSHLTYYYPTRTDLLVAVARAATEIQAANAQAMAQRIVTREDAADVIACGTARHENTRVLLALCEAAEQEPDVRALFNTLADGSIGLLMALLSKLGLKPIPAHADILHALFIGLSVTHLATGRTNGEARSKAALDAVFTLFAQKRAPRGK